MKRSQGSIAVVGRDTAGVGQTFFVDFDIGFDADFDVGFDADCDVGLTDLE
jgi:hypothetical protein